jgi:hypothetical protein
VGWTAIMPGYTAGTAAPQFARFHARCDRALIAALLCESPGSISPGGVVLAWVVTMPGKRASRSPGDSAISLAWCRCARSSACLASTG